MTARPAREQFPTLARLNAHDRDADTILQAAIECVHALDHIDALQARLAAGDRIHLNRDEPCPECNGGRTFVERPDMFGNIVRDYSCLECGSTGHVIRDWPRLPTNAREAKASRIAARLNRDEEHG